MKEVEYSLGFYILEYKYYGSFNATTEPCTLPILGLKGLFLVLSCSFESVKRMSNFKLTEQFIVQYIVQTVLPKLYLFNRKVTLCLLLISRD